MDTTTKSLEALLAKVDAVLRQDGTDPATIAEDDKIMLAVQYVEVATALGFTATHVYRGAFRL